jgi:hypothetical protein
MSKRKEKKIRRPALTLPEVIGSQEDVTNLARRLLATHPSFRGLGMEVALVGAQKMLMTGANPWRDEIQVWVDEDGHVHIHDGYKLVVRWARSMCPFTMRLVRLLPETCPEIDEDDIAYRCSILRQDAHATLKVLIEAGCPWEEAFDIASVYADGVVRAHEMTDDEGNPRECPVTGWTHDQMARKRAMTNALNLSHGSPSMIEIALASWTIGSTWTTPEDWGVALDAYPDGTPDEHAKVAQLSAQARRQLAQLRQMSDDELAAMLTENSTLLHGDPDDAEGI